MKTRYLSIIAIAIVLISCKDILDTQPIDKVLEDEVWQDTELIRLHLTDMYAKFPFNMFDAHAWASWTDEATQSSGNNHPIPEGRVSNNLDSPEYWDYEYIRELNVFLEKVAEASIPEADKNQFAGEARVMRAVAYFELQKRYGGVPLVDVVLDPNEEVDEQYSSRSSEEAIADFINSELNAAIDLLGENTEPKGQINQWTAYAFKARANLYSASIAKYGSVQLDGLVGIPQSRADEFFQKASEAANTVIESGSYSLFDQIPNRAENYRNIWINESNDEVIFERVYDGVNVGHNWDVNNVPQTLSSRNGGHTNPTLDFIMGYENADGSDGQPSFGPDHLYEDGWDLFSDKDPRLHGSVIFQGDMFHGQEIQMYESTDPSPTPDPSSIMTGVDQTYQGVPVSGASSRAHPDDRKAPNTGFLIKKFSAEPMVGENASHGNWIELRLAEMYLTRAEAEFELGNLDIAAEALNATRERAGISTVDGSTITLDHVRTERRSELAFEESRFWDLRRWRTAVDVLNGLRVQGLRIIRHHETGRFYFLPINAEGYTRVFEPRHYYNPITDSRIANNPDLVENPGY
ncbi:RagB/SusD family nutrient uptake outer membrane protein [Halalkalibaculum sp. DA384]|uniref:RagB/SusD family nutrient uptake outer membrane protein n=1 Tax=Halalkalibaculum sp. DA384 TaxID=3373606 RepID=UPI003753FF45